MEEQPTISRQGAQRLRNRGYHPPAGPSLGGGSRSAAVPLAKVENAFVLAASRRIFRAPGSPPPGTIRSLAYFSAVIEEVLELRHS